MKERNLAVYIVLTLLTCGLFALYWIYTLTEDTARLNPHYNKSGGMVIFLSIITFGIYSFFWIYNLGTAINEAMEQRNMTSGADSNLGLINLLLAIFGLVIVSYAISQDKLNKLAAQS